MNELEQYGSPFVAQGPAPRVISRRLYNAVLSGLVLLSFVVMALCSYVTGTFEFMLFAMRHPMLFTFGPLVASIAGIILMSIGRSRESLGMAMAGYVVFTLTFGFTTSMVLGMYDMGTISLAFTATAAIMVVFGLAGIAFPRFFARIQGVLIVGLLAIILVEFFMAVFGVHQGFTDIAVIVLFCGFIGYDVFRAATAVPTLTNAVWYAIDLYLDILNVFLRLLSLFGRRD